MVTQKSLKTRKQTMKDDGVIGAKEFGIYLEHRHKTLWLAVNHHRTHTNKKMTFKGHFYLKAILMDTAKKRVLKKSTQGGISECLIIISWNAANEGFVVFYVLPTDQLKNRFVSNRFEKSLFYTDHYRTQRAIGRSQAYRKENIDNRSLKDIGKGVINFAGSGSDVPFIEIPADFFIVDEADKCDANRLQMGLERLGHSSDPHEIYVGNPTFVGSFLDQKFNLSTKSRWFINADCGHRIQIDFFKHVVRQVEDNTYVIRDKKFEIGVGRDVRPICDICDKPFDRFGYGEYVNEVDQAEFSGKHVSRLFSGASTLLGLVDNFSKALENDYKLQRFYNSDLGESFTAEGSRLTEQSLDDCVDETYHMPESCTYPTIAGIDVGTLCHIVIGLPVNDTIRIVYVAEIPIQEPYEIIEIFKRFRVKIYVIDALPETRFARKLSSLYKVGFLCYYSQFKKELIVNVKDCILSADRTVSLDTLKESFVLQKMVLPANARSIKDLYDQMSSSVRSYNEEKDRYEWVESGPDHYFHAFNYMCLAKKILTMAT